MGRERRQSRLAGNRGLSFPRDVRLITRPVKRCSIFELGPKNRAKMAQSRFRPEQSAQSAGCRGDFQHTHGVDDELGPR